MLQSPSSGHCSLALPRLMANEASRNASDQLLRKGLAKLVALSHVYFCVLYVGLGPHTALLGCTACFLRYRTQALVL